VGRFGFYWGVVGVIIFLMFAVLRLSAKVVDMSSFPLGPLHWIALVSFVLYMAYAEGYKGFHKNFSPRIVARAGYLINRPDPLLIFLAPLFCMGYFHATRKRIIISIAVTSAIVVLVLIVGFVPQPWRGIIDAGVVVGLLIGVSSIIYFTIQFRLLGKAPSIPTDVPVGKAD
jgi:hypothetical protein